MAGEALRFDIFANDQFSKSFNKLKSHLPSIKTVALGAAAAIAGLGASLLAITKTTATAYDKIGKFADQTGLSTKFLSEMNVAAKFTAININTMNKSLERLQTGIGEAGRGIGMAKDTLEGMGIELHDATGKLKTAESILPELADRFKQMTSETERTEAAQKLFGQRGLEMIKVLKDGSEGLAKYADKAKAMGLIVDKQAAANAAKFNDALYEVKGTLLGLKNVIGERVMPIITAFAEKFSSFVQDNREKIINFGKQTVNAFWNIVESTITGGAHIIDFWNSLKAGWLEIKILFGDLYKAYDEMVREMVIKSRDFLQSINMKGVFDEALVEIEGFLWRTGNGYDNVSLMAKKAKEDLNALLAEGLNVDKVDDFIAKIKIAYEDIEAAGTAEVEAQREKNELLLTTQQEHFDLEKDAYYQQLQELAAMHDEYMLSDQQKLDQWYLSQVGKHQENSNALLKISDIYQKKQADIDKKAQEEKEKMRQMEKASMYTFLSNLYNMGKTFGKEAFRIAQIAGIAKAIMKTHEAVAMAIANPPGPPISFAYGAAALAYGMAQVKSIASQKYAAHGGMTNVPREQTMLLDRGERILSPNQNKDFTEFLRTDRGRGGVSIENMNILPNATRADALLTMSQAEWEEIVEESILPALRRLDNRGIVI